MTTSSTLFATVSWRLFAVTCVAALLMIAPSAAQAGGSTEEGSVSVTLEGIGPVDLSVSLEVAGGSVAAVTGETYAFRVAPGTVQVSLSSDGSTTVVEASCAPDTITIDISSQAIDGDDESHTRSLFATVVGGEALDCEFVVTSDDSSRGRFGAF